MIPTNNNSLSFTPVSVSPRAWRTPISALTVLDDFAPFEPFWTNSSSFRKLFDDFEESPRHGNLELDETESHYSLSLTLPKFKKDEIDVSVTQEGRLTINAKRTDPKHGEVQVHRALALGSDLFDEEISATLEHGVLVITVPKKQKIEPRKIAIR